MLYAIWRAAATDADGGETPTEVRELADRYIREGFTRQRAYARARKELKAPFRRRWKRFFPGGGASPR